MKQDPESYPAHGSSAINVLRTANFKKFKARYCVRGDLEEGVFDTFAPVVAWSTVRLFLIVTLSMDWYTCSIDFSNAFVQATLKDPIWIHLPRGFRSTRPGRTCLRLVKSLYGISRAPKLCYEHLLAALKHLGFVQSVVDPCLLLRKDAMILVCYCDDVGRLLAAKKRKQQINSSTHSVAVDSNLLKKEASPNIWESSAPGMPSPGPSL